MKIKSVFSALLVVLFAAILTMTAMAYDDGEKALTATEDYLTLLLENTYQYTDHDLTVGTVAKLPERTSIEIDTTLLGGVPNYWYNVNSSRLLGKDSIDYIVDMADYQRFFRSLYRSYHDEFSIKYDCKDIVLSEKYAKVELSALVSWQYPQVDEPSWMQILYVVYLYNSDGRWYVYDVTSNEWFDAWYKEDGFDVEEFKAGIVQAYENPGGVAASKPGTNTDTSLTAAEDYLTLLLENMNLYTDHDLTVGTVAELPERDSIEIDTTLLGGVPNYWNNVNSSRLLRKDSIDYIVDKADYYRFFRSFNNLSHNDFSIKYNCKSVYLTDKYAKVELSALVSCQYPQVDEPSWEVISYVVYLYNSDGRWYVYDVTSDDWFDAWYKEDGFDLEEFKGGRDETSENPGGEAASTPDTTAGAEALQEDPPSARKPQIAETFKILVFLFFVILVLIIFLGA